MRNLLIGTSLLVLSSLWAADPAELNNLRNSYQSAINRAVKPITDTYLVELTKLRDTYTRNANLEAANSVQLEIDLLNAKTAATVGTVGTLTTVLDAVAVVPANSMEGFKLGSVRRGDVITVSYVSGLWKSDGSIPTENPDAETTDRGDKTRLAIAESPKEGRPGDVIKMVPAHTRDKPFSYTVQTTREDVVLRIHYGGDNPKAPGSVTYKVKVQR
ncbi:hypothetical protein SAMN02745166_03259 [Prosthecobacter debontii]|uniref:Uncharacterized protein n=1 Tax=Prosthecobacter debontii TaxID=48467 RepID=A0A1T4YGZ4_9BACT|nr:hypothetical protein [Prosthecobacter debontii]SKB00930.1 hypothetical protein SAMN02745166_03259 [Prosthecobacter debontii]